MKQFIHAGWLTFAVVVFGVCGSAAAAEINTSALSENGWYSDDTRADGTGTESDGTNLISDTLTDDPEATASGTSAHDADILGQIQFGPAAGTVPLGTHPAAVHLQIGASGSGKSQISHRKDDGTGHGPGSIFGPGFSMEYSWMGDGTVSVTASVKFGIKTSEFGSTGVSGRTGENAWDKVLIYEPGNLNGGTSDGTWYTETVSHTSGRWWFFDRTAGAGIIGTPMTLEDMAGAVGAATLVGGGPKTAQDVYNLIVAAGAHITSAQVGIGSGNSGGSVYVNELETNSYRSGDVTTFGSFPVHNVTQNTDHATIQDAVDNAVNGDVIEVDPGTYTENVVLDESVTLNGAQAGVAGCGRVTGASPDPSVESVLTAASGIILELENGCAGSTIDGFAIDGMGVAANGIRSNGGPLDDLTFQNNFIGNTTSSGVFLNDSGEDITFFQNEVDGALTGGGGVVHLDNDNFDGFHFVDNCVLNTTAGTGLFVDGDHNIGVSGARSPLLDGNLFDNNLTGANLGRFAFEFGDITDNTFSNSLFDGLQGGIQNTEITGNVFTDNDRYGLALTGFGGSGDPTRGAQDLDINNNEFTGNATAGLLFSSGQFPGTISTNVANNNNFTGNAVGATYSGSETIDVSCNWWNDIGGPDAPPGNPNAAGDDATGSFVYWPWLDAAAPGGVCNQFGGDNVYPDPPDSCISTANPCLTVPVQFDRTDVTEARGISVTFELSPELELCSTPDASIQQGTWLDSFGSVYQVIDNGGGSYTVDQSILGLPCGTATGGELFTVDVTNTGGDGTGTITVTDVLVRDCVNDPLPGIPGPPADIEIDNTLPTAIANLAAAQVKTGNDADGTTEITLTWSPVEAGATVAVYRKGFGFYPEYDDDGGFEPAAPATPALAVGAGWTLTGVALSGDTDETNTERDFYYYVAFVTDECGNVSAVSNKTGGTLNYHLGDVVPVPPFGNNEVDIDDISKLGFHYGTQDGDALYLDTLDVGPTTDNFVNTLPETDDRIQFEDLILFAINFGQVSKPGPAPNGENLLTARMPAAPGVGETFSVSLDMMADGSILGMSIPLTWDAAVVEPAGFTVGDLLTGQAGQGVLFSPAPGTVDAAVFGSPLRGEGVLGTVLFRVKAAGDPAIALGEVLARDAENRPVAVQLGKAVDAGVLPSVTRLLPAAPNPFLGATLVRFGLAEAGAVSIRVYGVDGRLVRTLVDSVLPAGDRRIAWDGRDESGREVAAGSYIVRFRAGAEQEETQRVVRLR